MLKTVDAQDQKNLSTPRCWQFFIISSIIFSDLTFILGDLPNGIRSGGLTEWLVPLMPWYQKAIRKCSNLDNTTMSK